jgi:hypothetical protein
MGRYLVIFLFLSVFSGIVSMNAQSGLLEEKRRVGRVQATYLNHLINFTQWDKADLPVGGKTAKILILGNEDNGLIESFRFLAEQSQLQIGGNEVSILHFKNSEKKSARLAFECNPQVILVLSSATYNLDEIREITPKSLYIGDYKTLVTEQKGDIAFYLQKNRVRLIIDKVAFKRSSPKLSSQISTLRNVVEVTP